MLPLPISPESRLHAFGAVVRGKAPDPLPKHRELLPIAVPGFQIGDKTDAAIGVDSNTVPLSNVEDHKVPQDTLYILSIHDIYICCQHR